MLAKDIAGRGRRFIKSLGPATRLLLALNAFCWLLFLTREPVNAADYAKGRNRQAGGNEFSMTSAGPYVVASRTVAPGGWHGFETTPVATYCRLNAPALLAGIFAYLFIETCMMSLTVAIGMVAPAAANSAVLPTLSSWVLAGALFLITTLQWLVVGRLADRLIARVSNRTSEPRISRFSIAVFIVIAGGMTAWWWPAERENHLEESSYRGTPKPLLEALESEPQNAELWRRLGRSYRMKDRWAEALPAYRRSVELDPTNFGAWGDIRLSALCLKDEAEAERAAKRVFVLDATRAATRVSDPPECCAFAVCGD